ncbi:MAG TPA: S9 family peptidase [Vicinamibacterales bacterium]|nr:S9 family peptidase [Vicinamibacterales bacterium]
MRTQAPRPLGIVDMLSIPRLADPRLSPDGRDLLFTRSEADWKTGRRISHIWRAPVGDSSGGQPIQLTNGSESENAPRWSPDGRTIAFTAKRGDNEFPQLYLLPVEGGEARQLTTHASAVSDPSWTPDGTALYFSAPDPKTADEKARDKVRDDVYSYDENYKQTHLWKVTVASKAETRVTSGDFSVVNYELSEDGKKLVYHRWPTPLLGDNERGEVWVSNADGSSAVQLTKNAVPENDATLSPDDAQVLFVAGSSATFESYHNNRLFIVPAAGGTARPLVGENEPIAVDRAIWSKDGKSIYFLANLGVHEEIFVIPAAGGAPKQLTDGKHGIGAWSLTGDRLVMMVSDATSGGDVWTMKIGDAAPTRVTHVFDYLSRDFRLGRQEAIQWKGADGTTVEGLLTYPVDYQSGQKYPLAVITHGGPQASDKYSIGSQSAEVQVLAGKGYASLQPNYRGSTGYGDAFLRDMVGHYFQNAHLDVMTGVDEVIRRGVADPDKMVKMGWSGGGHMTNKIITFTDRFKAAASGAGAANWVSMYAQSDIRFQRTPWFGGTPWQKNAPIDVYWANSPLTDVANVKTPTIFFVGEKDPRVPMPQSVEMYRALKSLNVPTHLYIAPREPHGWGELRHQLSKLNLEIEWFEKYATQRPFTPEKAPGEKSDGKTTTDQQ